MFYHAISCHLFISFPFPWCFSVFFTILQANSGFFGFNFLRCHVTWQLQAWQRPSMAAPPGSPQADMFGRSGCSKNTWNSNNNNNDNNKKKTKDEQNNKNSKNQLSSMGRSCSFLNTRLGHNRELHQRTVATTARQLRRCRGGDVFVIEKSCKFKFQLIIYQNRFTKQNCSNLQIKNETNWTKGGWVSIWSVRIRQAYLSTNFHCWVLCHQAPSRAAEPHHWFCFYMFDHF